MNASINLHMFQVRQINNCLTLTDGSPFFNHDGLAASTAVL